MPYAQIKSGRVTEYPLYEGDIRLRFPNTSFPVPFSPPDGYELVADAPMPQVEWYQTVTEGKPKKIDGVWTRQWVISDASTEQQAEITHLKAKEVRDRRNSLLNQTDWYVVFATETGGAIPESVVNYRAMLRDISKQEGFPHSVFWPELPSTEPG